MAWPNLSLIPKKQGHQRNPANPRNAATDAESKAVEGQTIRFPIPMKAVLLRSEPLNLHMLHPEVPPGEHSVESDAKGDTLRHMTLVRCTLMNPQKDLPYLIVC